MVVGHLPDPILYMSNDNFAGWLSNNFHHRGRILLLALLFLIVPLTKRLKLLLGFTARCYSKGNMQSLQEQHSTQSEIVNWYMFCIKELFNKLPTVRVNMFLVCSSALRRTTFICSLNLKSLNGHVQYHYEIDQYSAICYQAHEKEYRALADLRDAHHSVPIDK